MTFDSTVFSSAALCSEFASQDHALDEAPALDDFRREVLDGLTGESKFLSCKWFYDQRGSQLFDAITELPEYYPTRVERSILCANGEDIARALGANCAVLEYGSGSSVKTRILLDALIHSDCAPTAYVPLDISREYLLAAATRLKSEYPDLNVRPVCADYTRSFALPSGLVEGAAKRVVFFPGSTVGNFEPPEAQLFLSQIAHVCGADGNLLIGVDLRKNPQRLNDAYNDGAGITAAFNLNVLQRINRELGADFDLQNWSHRAFYNEEAGRIEMHLDSRRDQTVFIGATPIAFRAAESIRTEYSYKYTVEGFAEVAARAGWKFERAWLDDDALFSVQLFSVALTLAG